MDEPTAEAVRRAQEGDELALARVVRAVYPTLYRWALLRTNDPDDADDVAQTALLRVHRHLHEFSFGARFTTWLYTIVRTAALDWHRTRRRQRASDERYGREAPRVMAAPDPEHIDLDRRLARVRDALAALPARQREVFDMFALQGMDTAEVGEILGVSGRDGCASAALPGWRKLAFQLKRRTPPALPTRYITRLRVLSPMRINLAATAMDRLSDARSPTSGMSSRALRRRVGKAAGPS